MCLASLPGDLENKDRTKTYSRHALFKIGKVYKHKPTQIISGQSAVFQNIQGSSEGAFLRYFSHLNPEKRTKIMGARLKNACRKEKTHENYGHAFSFSIIC